MTAAAAIRIGVIGTGVMGGNHTRIAAQSQSCQLVGIFDPNLKRANELAAQFQTQAFSSAEELCAQVDAVIVACPTNLHAQMAETCMRQGCHVLLEKPIASAMDDAQALVAFSEQCDKVLMIGHLERFNPAVIAAQAMIPPDELFDIHLQRLSPTPPRDLSADIIFDLMIHDIDLALTFAQSPIDGVLAQGHRVRGGIIDHVTALLHFASGATATLTASAVTHERVRRGQLYTPSAQYTLDLTTHEMWILRFGVSAADQTAGHATPSCQVEQIIVPDCNPLVQEQEHFIQVICSGTAPNVTAQDGLMALEIAQMVQDAVSARI